MRLIFGLVEIGLLTELVPPYTEVRFDAARELADRRGFKFIPAAQIAELPKSELVERIRVVAKDTSKTGEPDLVTAAAVLGGAGEPAITVTRALELYWDLTKEKRIKKSEDQIRRWENPRKKAVKNFVDIVGDKPIAEITRDDMLDFRAWWINRLIEEDMTPNSANKDFVHLGDVLKTVNSLKRLGLTLPLGDLTVKDDGDGKKRPSFTVEWLRDVILKPGALDGLNEEARAILKIMINTGARPSEIAALTKNTIHLTHNVPHISIEAEDRQLKTKRSKRVIPLVGVSLEAMREFPEGFPRYRLSSATLSATVNKFLRENKLTPSDDHVMYSIRHTMEDRMIAGRFDDRIRRDIFGHKLNREEYGQGASLKHMAELLQAIALT